MRCCYFCNVRECMWSCEDSSCLCWARNVKFDRIFVIFGVRFTDQQEIWRWRINLWCAVLHRISFESMNRLTHVGQKPQTWQILEALVLHTTLHWSGRNLSHGDQCIVSPLQICRDFKICGAHQPHSFPFRFFPSYFLVFTICLWVTCYCKFSNADCPAIVTEHNFTVVKQTNWHFFRKLNSISFYSANYPATISSQMMLSRPYSGRADVIVVCRPAKQKQNKRHALIRHMLSTRNKGRFFYRPFRKLSNSLEVSLSVGESGPSFNAKQLSSIAIVT